MITWPVIQTPDQTFSSTNFMPSIRTEFEDGYIATRTKHSKSWKSFRLMWNALSDSDYQTLETFFLDHLGDKFDWTNPIDLIEYQVYFEDPSLRSEISLNKLRKLELSLKEIA